MLTIVCMPRCCSPGGFAVVARQEAVRATPPRAGRARCTPAGVVRSRYPWRMPPGRTRSRVHRMGKELGPRGTILEAAFAGAITVVVVAWAALSDAHVTWLDYGLLIVGSL